MSIPILKWNPGEIRMVLLFVALVRGPSVHFAAMATRATRATWAVTPPTRTPHPQSREVRVPCLRSRGLWWWTTAAPESLTTGNHRKPPETMASKAMKILSFRWPNCPIIQFYTNLAVCEPVENLGILGENDQWSLAFKFSIFFFRINTLVIPYNRGLWQPGFTPLWEGSKILPWLVHGMGFGKLWLGRIPGSGAAYGDDIIDFRWILIGSILEYHQQNGSKWHLEQLDLSQPWCNGFIKAKIAGNFLMFWPSGRRCFLYISVLEISFLRQFLVNVFAFISFNSHHWSYWKSLGEWSFSPKNLMAI